MINNGDRVKDKVTGFEGIVTGVSEFLTGCRQCCVVPPAKDGKYEEGRWFDDDRLDLLQARAIQLTERRRTGGPQTDPAPVR